MLAMLVHRAQTSPLHWSPKVPFSITHQPGGSLGFSVRLPVSAFTGLCATGILDNNKTGTEKKGCLQDKSTTSLLCCIGKIWCFQVSRQVI